jgi:outer membrane protein assembly factor BamB
MKNKALCLMMFLMCVYSIASAATSLQVWEYTTGSRIFSSPAVSGGYVYVGSLDSTVYCLNAATGAKVWEYETGGRVWSSIQSSN